MASNVILWFVSFISGFGVFKDKRFQQDATGLLKSNLFYTFMH